MFYRGEASGLTQLTRKRSKAHYFRLLYHDEVSDGHGATHIRVLPPEVLDSTSDQLTQSQVMNSGVRALTQLTFLCLSFYKSEGGGGGFYVLFGQPGQRYLLSLNLCNRGEFRSIH
ncbi:hypothetical protein RRG08_048089 [Elysia crispata]|uniref:Uncharacterized protein n=1 Tax=Elysia crispata TaxID=231223 RepID=A0AAE1EAM9_9GAST|nr:hypothetical protein RRG08_048089 [Elysia crispata]